MHQIPVSSESMPGSPKTLQRAGGPSPLPAPFGAGKRGNSDLITKYARDWELETETVGDLLVILL